MGTPGSDQRQRLRGYVDPDPGEETAGKLCSEYFVRGGRSATGDLPDDPTEQTDHITH
jgi:hypothetical protein